MPQIFYKIPWNFLQNCLKFFNRVKFWKLPEILLKNCGILGHNSGVHGRSGLGAAPFLWHGLRQRRHGWLGHGRRLASLNDHGHCLDDHGKKIFLKKWKKMKNEKQRVRCSTSVAFRRFPRADASSLSLWYFSFDYRKHCVYHFQ